MKTPILVSAVAATAALIAGCTAPASKASTTTAFSATTSPSAVPPSKVSVVLVPGAFAEGSAWERVIPLLEQRGIHAVAVHDPMTSLADDVRTVTHVIDAQPPPVLLVGHSYGGTVITQAGNNENVKGLVYFAAFAPAEGETTADQSKNYPPPPWQSGLVLNDGFLTLSRETMATQFAQDLPKTLTDVMYATQGPIAAKAFDEPVTRAAWRTKPTMVIVTTQDRMIPPALQWATAKRIGAGRMAEVPTSHVGMLSKPDAVATLIAAAAADIQ